MRAYQLVNATAVQGLHGTLGCARVVVLDETVIEALGLVLISQISKCRQGKDNEDNKSTHILVRDDLHILNMASGLEDLAQNVLSDTRIQTTNVQSPLVGLRGGAAGKRTAA